MPRHPQGQHRGPAAAAPRQQQHRWRRLLARREPCLWLRQLLPARLLMRMGNCQAPQMRAVSCFLARPQPLRLSGYAVCNATQMLQQGHQPVAALGPAGDAKPRRWCAPAAGWLRRASLCRLHQRQHRGQPRRLQQLRASRPAQTAGTHFQTAGCCLPTVKVGTRISRLRRCRLWPQRPTSVACRQASGSVRGWNLLPAASSKSSSTSSECQQRAGRRGGPAPWT